MDPNIKAACCLICATIIGAKFRIRKREERTVANSKDIQMIHSIDAGNTPKSYINHITYIVNKKNTS